MKECFPSLFTRVLILNKSRMMIRWLNGLNLALLAAIFCAVVFLLHTMWSPLEEPLDFGLQSLSSSQSLGQKGGEEKRIRLPSPFLHLERKAPEIQLPDLRRHLLYLGRNQRPDVEASQSVLHLGLRGKEETSSLSPGEKLFLMYQRDEEGKGAYGFSPNNRRTGLWVEGELPSPTSLEVEVRVGMEDLSGNPVKEPSEFLQFTLKPSPSGKGGGAKWKLDQWRVDASLLARLKARWYGRDRFMREHGGEEFRFTEGKERIDFGSGTEGYAVYLSEGEGVIWKEGRWHPALLGEESRSFPLLLLERVNGKLMHWALWDSTGRSKTQLNLIRARVGKLNQRLFSKWRFLGAKTRTQAILEIDGQRTVIQVHDWVLHTREGWQVLDSLEEIDRYVSRQLKGELFVYDGIVRSEGHQVLTGHIFDTARHTMMRVELPVSTGEGVTPPLFIEAELPPHEKESEEGPLREVPPDFPEELEGRKEGPQVGQEATPKGVLIQKMKERLERRRDGENREEVKQ